MDTCRINYSASRTGMMQPKDFRFQNSRRIQTGCSCSDKVEDTALYKHVDHLPLAMAYVPSQRFGNTFALGKALQMGTIFPELCKPFCGRRGVCR